MVDRLANQFDVFLSYHWRDHAQVEALAKRLREHRLTAFLDRWYLTPGQSWPKELETTLARCRAVAVCIGQGEMGPWQQREQYLALERQVAAERQGLHFPVIPVLLPGAEPPLGFLGQNTWVDFRARVDDPVPLNTLVNAVHGQSPGPEARETIRETLATICPYRGLLHFREEDAPFFFGREAAITQLVSAVQQHTLVAVVGPSGSGKSSVVRAGLVPELRRSRDQVWEVATIVPTDRPIHALAAELIPLLEPDVTETDRLIETNKLAEVLLNRSVKLREVIGRVLAKQSGTDRVLLIVDQWEELFTLCKDDAARRCFIDSILEATATTKLSVVLTLRGDFFGLAITDNRPLSDRIQGAQLNLGPMLREELRLAIEEPAKTVGLTFETGLVDRILEQVSDEPGHLPLVEFVLRRLWEDRQGGHLHHAAYKAMGELQGAIAQKAESLFMKLNDEDQRKVQQIFLRLVRPGERGADTRRRATFSDVGTQEHRLAKQLTDERLLVTSQRADTGEETIEVSHEALIRHWDRLKGWVNADRQFLVWQQRLTGMRKEWEASQRSADLLLHGLPLREGEEWLRKRPESFSPEERAFITISQSRRIKVWVAAAIGAGVVLWLISGMAWLRMEGYTFYQARLKIESLVHSISLAPQLVQIPGGSFQMGDVEGLRGSSGNPVHSVTIKSFRLGKYEVTFDEYDRFAIATGGRLPEDRGWGRGKRPVISVSWHDANAYAAWISKETGNHYRLPTESEWEYAARSGARQETWAGTSKKMDLDTYAVFRKNSSKRTMEVGTKASNEFGIHDLNGNVWEWVEDCGHGTYDRAPSDGSAWLETDGESCDLRMVRGGGWLSTLRYLCTSCRDQYNADGQTSDIGFRLAQDIEP